MENIDPKIIEKAQSWLGDLYDKETQDKVRELIQNNHDELTESFYKNLEFGTGGLRGIMGVGTNRMNRYTVAMATQGFANYIKKMFPTLSEPAVAIAYDCRNNSPLFAQVTADVMSANGIKVYLFESLRPTPELSFAVRELHCQAGVMITASHNPKEYNGYKAYWEDGGQLISPHDKNVIKEVEKITEPSMVRFDSNPERIVRLGNEFDDIYLKRILKLELSHEAIEAHKDLKIVYTPIHGTGRTLVPEVLKRKGFCNVTLVEQQMTVDGDFPTVKSPNPEEQEALSLAIKKAAEIDAELVIATDPDADRVGIAIKRSQGEYTLLNGNQTASLLIYYILKRNNELGLLHGNEYIVKTIVTTELLSEIAKKHKVKCYDVLTGFKYIACKILELEGKEKFLGGGEESYGYLVDDFVRDKDAVIAASMIAETAAWAANNGMNLLQMLHNIYKEFGVYKEHLVSITKKGITGAEEIKAMMRRFRDTPPTHIANSKIIQIKDYLSGENKEIKSGNTTKMDFPKSDVLQFLTEDGYKVSVRPSGTEPKIKFYFSARATMDHDDDVSKTENLVDIILKNMSDEITK